MDIVSPKHSGISQESLQLLTLYTIYSSSRRCGCGFTVVSIGAADGAGAFLQKSLIIKTIPMKVNTTMTIMSQIQHRQFPRALNSPTLLVSTSSLSRLESATVLEASSRAVSLLMMVPAIALCSYKLLVNSNLSSAIFSCCSL